MENQHHNSVNLPYTSKLYLKSLKKSLMTNENLAKADKVLRILSPARQAQLITQLEVLHVKNNSPNSLSPKFSDRTKQSTRTKSPDPGSRSRDHKKSSDTSFIASSLNKENKAKNRRPSGSSPDIRTNYLRTKKDLDNNKGKDKILKETTRRSCCAHKVSQEKPKKVQFSDEVIETENKKRTSNSPSRNLSSSTESLSLPQKSSLKHTRSYSPNTLSISEPSTSSSVERTLFLTLIALVFIIIALIIKKMMNSHEFII